TQRHTSSPLFPYTTLFRSINNQTLYNLSANGLPLTFETDFAKLVEGSNSVVGVNGNVAKVNINYGKVNSTSNAWLDYIEINFKRDRKSTRLNSSHVKISYA